MSNNFDGPILLDNGEAGGSYIGFGRLGSASTNARIYNVSSSPNGVLTAPRGSIALRDDAGSVALYQNIDGATLWVAIVAGLGEVTVVNASPYVALATDQILLVDVSPCTITLLAVAAALNTLVIKDRTGSASGANPLTFNAAGAETVDGDASGQIVVPYGSVTLVPNGTEWSII